ncbi:CBS domain-containing protein [Streptomyces sp. NPDC002889]|uniref:CBS domain-containing protein n=1 Tax=Streptomyces sp. NPDC002889 TaxID=3364669 RepID=UPI00369C8C33
MNRSTGSAGDVMGPLGPQVCDDMMVDVALSVLVSARSGHLIICDQDGRCTGLVTRAQLENHRRDSWYTERTRLRDIVHDRAPFTSSATPVRTAERAMRDRQLEASPVVDGEGCTIGVLALSR